MREPESLDVTFKTSMSEADNCICDACHAAGRVMKLTYPTTLYYDGNHLSTKYHEFWLCEKCLEKLAFALDKLPTIDAVPVVRCCQCKNGIVLQHSDSVVCYIGRMPKMGFCSYGKRKEGADNEP